MLDPLMQVRLLDGLTLQQKAWAGMHQCFSHRSVEEEIDEGLMPSEEKAGELLVKHLLAGGRGHYGPLEELGITVAFGYMPHSVMQQLRTHRIAVTFDCQSMRYTSQGLLDAASQIGILDLGHPPDIEALERVFYLRQPGPYRDRFGANYVYTEMEREADLELCWENLKRYAKRIEQGFSEEHARGILPFDYRQHFVVSFNNIRSLWHMLDLRMGKGAQGEAQHAMDLLWQATQGIAPQLQDWYQQTRAGKARLAP